MVAGKTSGESPTRSSEKGHRPSNSSKSHTGPLRLSIRTIRSSHPNRQCRALVLEADNPSVSVGGAREGRNLQPGLELTQNYPLLYIDRLGGSTLKCKPSNPNRRPRRAITPNTPRYRIPIKATLASLSDITKYAQVTVPLILKVK